MYYNFNLNEHKLYINLNFLLSFSAIIIYLPSMEELVKLNKQV